MRKWETFQEWHRDPAFWRDVYKSGVSALVVALVLYLVAGASGLIGPRQQAAILVGCGLAALGSVLILLKDRLWHGSWAWLILSLVMIAVLLFLLPAAEDKLASAFGMDVHVLRKSSAVVFGVVGILVFFSTLIRKRRGRWLKSQQQAGNASGPGPERNRTDKHR